MRGQRDHDDSLTCEAIIFHDEEKPKLLFFIHQVASSLRNVLIVSLDSNAQRAQHNAVYGNIMTSLSLRLPLFRNCFILGRAQQKE